MFTKFLHDAETLAVIIACISQILPSGLKYQQNRCDAALCNTRDRISPTVVPEAGPL